MKEVRGPDHNKPKRHHYIPVFFLKRWALDGKVLQFSRLPTGRVVTKRVAPSGTGFVDNLYSLTGFPPVLAQQVEELFLSPVDSRAADAMRILHGERPWEWSSGTRTAWTRFLLSLLLRSPEDLKLFKENFHLVFLTTDGPGEQQYAASRLPKDPPTYAEYLKAVDPRYVEQHALQTWIDLLNETKLGQHINDMKWWVSTYANSEFDLMCSDRPLIMTNGLDAPNSHICLPIGPYRAFWAANDFSLKKSIDRHPDRISVREINKMVVERAARYVYATNQDQLRFVQNRMSRRPPPTIMQKLIDERVKREAIRRAV